MIGSTGPLMGRKGLSFGLSSGIYGFFEEHATGLSLPQCDLAGGAGRVKNSRYYINSAFRSVEQKKRKRR